MPDIASLGIEVKTDSVKQAADDLDKLSQSGEQAEKSTEAVGKTLAEAGNNAKTLATSAQTATQAVSQVGNANRTAAQSGAELVAALKEQVAIFGKSSEDVIRYKAGLVGVQHSVEPLIQQLQNLAQAQDAAARSAAEEAATFAAVQQAQTALSTSQYNFLEGLREEVALFGKTSDELLTYQARLLGVSQAADPLIKQLQDQKNAQTLAAKAAADEADAQRQAGIAKQSAESQQRAFIANLREQAELQGKSRAEILEYRAAQLGVGDQASQYIKQIRDFEDATNRSNNSLKNGAVSAGQYKQALALLPAQFTDIAVGLSTGQSPFTVLLQQGGQLKDSFGGIAPAFAEISRYVVGLINPFTLAAAAVAALGLAYKQGSDEQTAYAKSLILTGNAAGTTSSQLASMAKGISGAVGTVGDAAEVLTQLAGTGKIAASSFDTIAVAALKMQEATGKATSETVAEFAKLADDPVKASKALNDELNYLTTATYAQIQALQDSGDQLGAQALAEQTYADALSQRADAIQENLGYIESGWKAVKDAARSAWDAVLDIGREQTLEDKLDSLAKRLRTMSSSGGLGGGLLSGFEAMQGDRSGIQSEITKALQDEQSKTEKAWREGLSAFNEKQGIAAVDAITDALKASDDNAKKLSDRIKQINQQFATAKQNGVIFTEAQRQQLINAAQEQYKDKTPKPKAEKAYTDDAATRMLQSLREQGAELQAQLGTQDKLTSAQKAQAQFQQLITDLKSKGQLTADQKSLLANQNAISAQIQMNVSLDDQVQKRQELIQLQEREAQLQETMSSSLEGQRDQYQRQLDSFGMGKEQLERVRSQGQIFKEYQRYQSQLDKATPKDLLGSAQYKDAVAEIKDGLNEALAANEDYYDKLDKMRGDWKSGAKESFADYLASAKDVSGQTYDLFSNALKGTEDSLVEFVRTGKLSFSDLADSIISDLIRIQVRQSLAYAVGGESGSGGLVGLLGSIGSLFSSGSGASSAASASTYKGAYGFDGGGYTGDLPRMGGVDGKGGFMAILHPQETVIDHTKPSRSQGGNSTSNTFHINVSGGGSDRENKQAGATIGREINRVIQRSARFA